MTLAWLCRGREADKPLASFVFEREARFSDDGVALYAATLWLCPDVVRSIVAGVSLFDLLHSATLWRDGVFHEAHWTWCWGVLQLFETGAPTLTQCVFLRGVIGMPDPAAVFRYVKQAP